MRLHIFAALFLSILSRTGFGQQSVSFPVPGRADRVEADLYGRGAKYVILAHGGRFAKESWKKQAERLAGEGFTVLAVRYRGDTVNPDGSPNAAGSNLDNAEDVIAAVTYSYRSGAGSVFAVGGSLGGDAVGEAETRLRPGRISRIVILGASGGSVPQKLNGRKLFIVSRNDRSASGPRLPEIRKHFERVPEPKKLVIVDGSAHAQLLFDTDQGPKVMEQIIRFFEEP